MTLICHQISHAKLGEPFTFIAPDNTASIRMMGAAGFEPSHLGKSFTFDGADFDDILFRASPLKDIDIK